VEMARGLPSPLGWPLVVVHEPTVVWVCVPVVIVGSVMVGVEHDGGWEWGFHGIKRVSR
jgi:hypothetical protein